MLQSETMQNKSYLKYKALSIRRCLLQCILWLHLDKTRIYFMLPASFVYIFFADIGFLCFFIHIYV